MVWAAMVLSRAISPDRRAYGGRFERYGVRDAQRADVRHVHGSTRQPRRFPRNRGEVNGADRVAGCHCSCPQDAPFLCMAGNRAQFTLLAAACPSLMSIACGGASPPESSGAGLRGRYATNNPRNAGSPGARRAVEPRAGSLGGVRTQPLRFSRPTVGSEQLGLGCRYPMASAFRYHLAIHGAFRRIRNVYRGSRSHRNHLTLI